MYNNLASLLHSKKITMKQYAEFLQVSEKTAQNKIRGRTAFTFPEVKKTSSLLFPEYTIDYLFNESRNAD